MANNRDTIPYSDWLNTKLQEQIQKAFLLELLTLLGNQKNIDKTFLERKCITVDGKPITLTEFEKYEPFTKNGNLNTTNQDFRARSGGINYSYDKKSIVPGSILSEYGLNDNGLNGRERLVMEAGCYVAKDRVKKQLALSDKIPHLNTSPLKFGYASSQEGKEGAERVQNFFDDAIREICKKIARPGLETVTEKTTGKEYYQINPDMENSITELVGEQTWVDLVNAVNNIKAIYNKSLETGLSSRKKYQQATIDLANATMDLTGALDSTHDDKIKETIKNLKKYFDDQTNANPNPLQSFLYKEKASNGYAEFIKTLNEHQSKNHFARMVGLVLKSLVVDRYVPNEWIDRDLREALNSLEFPQKYAEEYKPLKPVDVNLIGTKRQEKGQQPSNNNNNNQQKKQL